MKKILLTLIVMCSPLAIWRGVGGEATMYAQTAVLDKAAAQLKKDGGVSVEYRIGANGANGTNMANGTNGANGANGKLDVMGKKFHSDMEGIETWYDGKQVWTYYKQNSEVYLSEPTKAELAKVNPYYFLDIYKREFKGSSKGVQREFKGSPVIEVTMTATEKTNSIQKAVVRVGKADNRIKYIKVTGKNGNVIEVTVTSYKVKQKFTDATFRFDKAKHPGVDLIDMR